MKTLADKCRRPGRGQAVAGPGQGPGERERFPTAFFYYGGNPNPKDTKKAASWPTAAATPSWCRPRPPPWTASPRPSPPWMSPSPTTASPQNCPPRKRQRRRHRGRPQRTFSQEDNPALLLRLLFEPQPPGGPRRRPPLRQGPHHQRGGLQRHHHHRQFAGEPRRRHRGRQGTGQAVGAGDTTFHIKLNFGNAQKIANRINTSLPKTVPKPSGRSTSKIRTTPTAAAATAAPQTAAAGRFFPGTGRQGRSLLFLARRSARRHRAQRPSDRTTERPVSDLVGRVRVVPDEPAVRCSSRPMSTCLPRSTR